MGRAGSNREDQRGREAERASKRGFCLLAASKQTAAPTKRCKFKRKFMSKGQLSPQPMLLLLLLMANANWRPQTETCSYKDNESTVVTLERFFVRFSLSLSLTACLLPDCAHSQLVEFGGSRNGRHLAAAKFARATNCIAAKLDCQQIGAEQATGAPLSGPLGNSLGRAPVGRNCRANLLSARLRAAA